MNLEHVQRAYVGKKRACMCGCKGTYTERGENAVEALRILRTIQANESDIEFNTGLDNETIASIDLGSKTYAVYLSGLAQR
jgi:hypothetical protein